MAAPLLHLIAGARPNFMKLAPLVRALRADGRLAWKLIHTGQHHDAAMSGVFFDELGLPPPDVSLDCHGGGHAQLTARIMQAGAGQIRHLEERGLRKLRRAPEVASLAAA